MARILVVEASEEVRALTVDVLTADGHEVDCFGSGAEALARLHGSTFDLILSDLTIPAIEGIGLYWEIASRWPQLISRLVYITGAIDAAMSTTIVGTLVELRDTCIVLDGNTHITLPPSMKVENLVVGERLRVTATQERGQWIAERIEG